MNRTISIGSDFSGVGSFEQALDRLGINYCNIFACDKDKYARKTYELYFGTPNYYPEDVYDREMPKKSLDIYMTSHPCQAFSIAGKRKGKADKRGILFYNSLEFIRKNKPRFFIFENVKGLLSHDKSDPKSSIGKTFSEWINCLGGKSVNGSPVLFPYEDSVPYHIYWNVLNAKDYGVPQNRERVFIVGIRDDKDNRFRFPKPDRLTKRLKDILETNVDEKYYLSDTMVKGFLNHQDKNSTIAENIIKDGFINQDTQASTVYNQNGTAPTISAGTHGYANGYLKVPSATTKGYEVATVGDSINLSQIKSKTRRGRVGKGVAQTLDTACNQSVVIGAFRGRNPENSSDRTAGAPTEQRLEINDNGLSNTITTVQKDNVVVIGNLKGGKWDKTHEQSCRVYGQDGVSPTINTMGGGNQEPKILEDKKWIKGGLQKNQPLQTDGISPCLTSAMGMGGGHTPFHNYDYRIRRLTPTECFRLMDFNPDFIETVIGSGKISDTQLYKQAGNSIVVAVLAKIINNIAKL